MKQCFAYIRVSTTRQGEESVSLQEQREAIIRYAERRELEITHWYEEQQTAAKRGRPVFVSMLQRLKKHRQYALLVHKIDRSARNLRDWADLGELIDQGVDVHFANESLDMRSRGGRLAADIQAVVAADYIRNLREEVRKGFYGRLRQGFYPLQAPLGYVDHGSAKVKTIDPIKGPLVRRVFELYASGRFSLTMLREEAWVLGLRNHRGTKLCITSFSNVLRNPFYLGTIRLRSTKEEFPGKHEPLVNTSLFRAVQLALRGKRAAVRQQHDHFFRRLLNCDQCGRLLVGELKKGHVYYRCHVKACPQKCIREEVVLTEVLAGLKGGQISPEDTQRMRERFQILQGQWGKAHNDHRRQTELHLASVRHRMERLLDVYVDEVIDRDTFFLKQQSLVSEEHDLMHRQPELPASPGELPVVLEDVLALARNLPLQLFLGMAEERRRLLLSVLTRAQVRDKTVSVTLHPLFCGDVTPETSIDGYVESVWQLYSRVRKDPVLRARLAESKWELPVQFGLK
jgi:site-specific DNA recombinase